MVAVTSTPYSGIRGSGQPLLRLPEIGSDRGSILNFRDRWFNYRAVYRNRHMERMAMNVHYFLGNQWLELDTQILLDGVRGYAFKESFFRGHGQTGRADMPRPYTNYVAPAVQVEMSSLGKRELVPNILTTSSDPRLVAAAKVAKAILEHRLKVNDWADLRDAATFLTIVTGTGCIRSYWDETYNELTTIGNPQAVQCPQCGTTLSNPVIPFEALEKFFFQGIESATKFEPPAEEGGEPGVMLHQCPTCGGQMQPLDLNPDQAAQGQDFIGRPLGQTVPKGNTSIEVVTPFDLFPQNSGIDVTPQNCRIWGQSTIRDIDMWVAERYPQQVDDVQPENPNELMRFHPVLGNWYLLGRYDTVLDSGIYQNHVRVYEVHAEPSYRFPDGRSLVIAGNTILEDGPLMRTAPDGQGGQLKVPKVQYAAAIWEPRQNEFWGKALLDDLISPQNRINGMDAQIIEARERMGSPNLLVPEDADLSGPEFLDDYGAGKIMRYQPSALDPTAKPEVFGSILMPDGVYEERQACIADMKEVAGPQDIEIGEAPRNISTTSGLQILGEQAERRRAARERSLISMFQEIWEHQLRLLWVLRTDPDNYEVEGVDGVWEVKQYDRMALQGQTKVTVEKQAYVDKSLWQREGTREAQADQLYTLNNQRAIKKLLEYRNLPTDVNEDLNRQVDLAERQWTDFVDNGVVPYIDTSMDDPRIRFQTLGTLWLTDEGQELQESMDWPTTYKKIVGWEPKLAQAEQQDAMVRQFYGGNDNPQDDAPVYAQAMTHYQQAMEEYQTHQQEMEQALHSGSLQVGMAPPPAAPPQKPPPPIFLPNAKEARIYGIWKQMIQQADQQAAAQAQQGGQPPPPQPNSNPDSMQLAQRQDSFLKFRAVIDAYKIMAQAAEQQQMMGAPKAAAPGTPEGSPGIGGASPGLQPPPPGTQPPNPPATPQQGAPMT